jgi:hypothetical protein
MGIKLLLTILLLVFSISSYGDSHKCLDRNGKLVDSKKNCPPQTLKVTQIVSIEEISFFSTVIEKVKNFMDSMLAAIPQRSEIIRYIQTTTGKVKNVGGSVSTISSQSFKCDGRTHCSQMTSCAEATFFINHCPNTKMDGDNDGVPCEMQFCN